MKKIFCLLMLLIAIFSLSSCDPQSMLSNSGVNGKSAYEIAVENGYEGSVDEWLASLVGKDGASGANGTNGADGKSAYELAVSKGYKGTEEEWLASLVGEVGAAGKNGTNGKSAYELAVEKGYKGTEDEWLASLVGRKGEQGNDGITPQLKIGEDNYWYVSYDNGTTWNTLNVKATGPQGEEGTPGREIIKAEVIDGCFWITYSDSSTPINLGNVRPTIETDNHNTFELSLLSDNTLAITGLKDDTLTEIIIPTMIDGVFVTKIASNAFENNTSLESVTVSDSVTTIGNSSFKDCINLKTVAIGTDSGLLSIDAEAFYGCTLLEYVYIPKSTNYIGAYAFYGSGLKSAYFENPQKWNVIGTYNGYPAYFNPVGLSEAASMLKGTYTYSEKTYDFFKQNWLSSDANVGVYGHYYVDIGSRD